MFLSRTSNTIYLDNANFLLDSRFSFMFLMLICTVSTSFSSFSELCVRCESLIVLVFVLFCGSKLCHEVLFCKFRVDLCSCN